jgi:hypothetical protein
MKAVCGEKTRESQLKPSSALSLAPACGSYELGHDSIAKPFTLM